MLYQIYLITNKINGKQYIGQTRQDIGYLKRFNRHCKSKSKDLLHNALNKYGQDNFTVTLIEDNIKEEDIDICEMK